MSKIGKLGCAVAQCQCISITTAVKKKKKKGEKTNVVTGFPPVSFSVKTCG